jgi:uncharacterized Zn-finger protein
MPDALGIGHAPGYGLTSTSSQSSKAESMADNVVPHFHNDLGVSVIEIGAHEFMCVGAKPPFDHPHVFLDMGDEHEIVCPYCSTFYRHNPSLDPHAARPPECALTDLGVA